MPMYVLITETKQKQLQDIDIGNVYTITIEK